MLGINTYFTLNKKSKKKWSLNFQILIGLDICKQDYKH